MGKAQEKYPSVLNSLMGVPPMEGHIIGAQEVDASGLDCRSSTACRAASCSVMDRVAIGTNDCAR